LQAYGQTEGTQTDEEDLTVTQPGREFGRWGETENKDRTR